MFAGFLDTSDLGSLTHEAVLTFLNAFPNIEQSIRHVISGEHSSGCDPATLGSSETQLDMFRKMMSKVLNVTDIGPSCSEECPTDVRGDLYARWAEIAKAPGAVATAWCWQGVPAGVTETPALDAASPITHKPTCRS